MLRKRLLAGCLLPHWVHGSLAQFALREKRLAMLQVVV
jgi:hypothetical protein